MPEPLVQVGLILDASDGSHELREYRFPEVVGPVDFGLKMMEEGDYLCIGTGVLAGSILPGSNRLIVTGRSPVWEGFYVSTLGGGSLIWDGTGLAYLAIGGKAAKPSVLVLTGAKGKYPSVRLTALDDLDAIWQSEDGPGGFYALQRHVFEKMWDGSGTPRVLAVGPSARSGRMGAIGSSRTRKGKLTAIDCWAGRGGFGSKMLGDHNICAVIYGGDFDDEDLSDRAEADGYFQKRFSKKMKLVDLETTTKYRYDPKWSSGGTFGVNYSKLTDLMFSFNYRSVCWTREQRHSLWERLVRDHYLKQFNEETIANKKYSHCGEPCPAVCKKYWGEYKKDYEPYQTMGPLIGVFDQRVAEKVNHHADELGFDGIQIGGYLAWIMECLEAGLMNTADLGLADVPNRPIFEPIGFNPVADSQHNGALAMALLDKCAEPGHLLARGMRAVAAELGPAARDRAVYLANGEGGWMVPNQYWVPGMFAPQSVMGKYYVYYKFDYHPPRELGRMCAERMLAEVQTDNAGMCRFHRGWSEKMWAEIVCGHFEVELDYPAHHARLAGQIHAQGRPVYWESARVEQLIHEYLRAVREDSSDDADLGEWLWRFGQDRHAAAKAYWEEIRQGIAEGFSEPDPDCQ